MVALLFAMFTMKTTKDLLVKPVEFKRPTHDPAPSVPKPKKTKIGPNGGTAEGEKNK